MFAKDKKIEDEEMLDENIAAETAEDLVAEDCPEDAAEPAADEATDKQKLEEDFNKLKNDYVRLYAEMDNMKKRNQQEAEKTIKFAISSFAKELLGVADNLERAINAMADNDSCAELLKGVELTQNELTKVFAKFGIQRFNHIGQKFDPNFERVVQEIDDPKAESGVILTELQAGYLIHDRILREAMVVVAR